MPPLLVSELSSNLHCIFQGPSPEAEFLGLRPGNLNVDSGLGSHPGSVTHYLYDLECITEPHCAFVSQSIKCVDNSTFLVRIMAKMKQVTI